MSLEFNQSGFTTFHAKLLSTIKLSQKTWQCKTSKPERWHLEYNIEKIKTTLSDPDEVHKSAKNPEDYVFYKKFEDYQIREGITAPALRGFQYLAIVVSTTKKLIKTIYPTDKIKRGERLWPQ